MFVVIGLLLVTLVSVPADADDTWVATPIRQLSDGGDLQSVDCPTEDFCMAIASRRPVTDEAGHATEAPYAVLVKRSGQWAAIPSPVPPPDGGPAGLSELASVTCPSATFCTTFGQSASHDLWISFWNGASWTNQVVPHFLGTDVVGHCPTTTFCMAAIGGQYRYAHTLVWRRGTWSELRTGSAALTTLALGALECLDTTHCFVGSGIYLDEDAPRPIQYGRVTAWSGGSAWADVGQLDSPVTDISCSADDHCLAVADDPNSTAPLDQLELAQGAWITTAADSWTSRVSCPGQDRCASVTRAQHGATPYPRSFSPPGSSALLTPGSEDLRDLSCPSTTHCTITGMDTSGRAAAWTWTPAGVTKDTVPVVADSLGTSLSGIHCWTASSCIAVGSVAGRVPVALPYGPVVYRGSGRTWSRLAETIPADTVGGISCPTVDVCYALGKGSNASGAYGAVVLRRDSSGWRRVLFVGSATLTDIACRAATSCVVLGTTSTVLPLLYTSDNTGWTRRSIDRHSSYAATACTADLCRVAINGPAMFNGPPVRIDSWDGSSWSADPFPAMQGVVRGLDCGSTSNCLLTVGMSVVVRRASGWQVAAPPQYDTGPGAVSCGAPSVCMVLDGRQVLRWQNGAFTALDPSPANVFLSSLSCATANSCSVLTSDGGYRDSWVYRYTSTP